MYISAISDGPLPRMILACIYMICCLSLMTGFPPPFSICYRFFYLSVFPHQTFPVHSPNRSASFSHSDSGTCGMEASPISFARASMARMDLKK